MSRCRGGQVALGTEVTSANDMSEGQKTPNMGLAWVKSADVMTEGH